MPAFEDPEIYRKILDSLQIGVSVIDLQRKIVFWSDGAEQLTGFSRMDALGHDCADNILPHCNQERCEMCNERCPLAMALHELRAVEAVSFIHHKSGHQAPVQAWAIPLRNQHGSMIGVIQTFEGEVTLNGPDPNAKSMQEHGCLDTVTDLPNRPMMRSHLRETLAKFAEFQIPFGVVCVGVPELDEVRLRYGKAAATTLLQVLARTLRNTAWHTDFVGRWSDSRFLMILCGCDAKALQSVAGRIERMIAGASILWWGEALTVTALVGSASATRGDSVESVVRRALHFMGEKPAKRELSGRAAAASTTPGTTT